MNRIRLIVATGIIGGFVWLNWWVVPPMGLFHMSLIDPPLPANGYALVFFHDGKSINAATLNMLKTGWSIIWHIWPFAVAGLFSGLMIGYPLGELAGRKLAIAQASDEAIRLSEELFMATQEREVIAENTLKKVQVLNTEARGLQKKISQEKQKIFVMKVTAETELEAAQGFRQRNASLRKELNKARAKIRRLEKRR
ncbi:MAG TPA: hypothetical protein EYG88_04465 [Desulfocapsa sulfexigens]|nr:hypothetical protein [Desulfocapsa sulfexigens]